MDVGFDTVGNATLIVYDRGPLLVTDPWTTGPAYFGSWSLSHAIPDEQREAIARSSFVWISHGHPDHLSAASLDALRDKVILLPDHIGGRIARDLQRSGYVVRVLTDNQWEQLSDRVRIRSTADPNQDATLLVDVNGRLVVNVNDSTERASTAIRREIRRYPVSFLLKGHGFGDANMINFFDEAGDRVVSPAELRKRSGYRLGADVARVAETFGVRYTVPFSAMHQYQRSDSVWANATRSDLADYANGFRSARVELLPAFVRWDAAADSVETLDPQEMPPASLAPSDFGDDWAEELETGDVRRATEYFRRIENLGQHLDFVNLRVGGRDNVIALATRRFGRGVTFEVPRHSLMQALEWEVFDDLLIGNFMRTTLHGGWPRSGLYPDFTPYVAKYADNGRARTLAEVEAYFGDYLRRMRPVDAWRWRLERRAAQAFRGRISKDAPGYALAERTYWRIRATGTRAWPRPRAR